MKRGFPWRLLIALLTGVSLAAAACGPSPQKIVRQMVIQAAPVVVWAAIRDPAAIAKWHPAVSAARLEHSSDADGVEFQSRQLTLAGGGALIERVGATDPDGMKQGYSMLKGTLAVSNYSSWIQVRAGPGADESTVSWSGRFSNGANAIDAPPGADNDAAMAAVDAYYQTGLAGLKRWIESSH